MEILLMFLCGYIILLGYFSVKKVDRFIDKINTEDAESHFINTSRPIPLLVMGESDLSSKFRMHLEELNIPFDYIEDESSLNTSFPYPFYFALSLDDLSNLSLCIMVTKLIHSSNVVTSCNNPSYIPLYERNGITYYNREQIDEFFLISNYLVHSSNKH
ncbi:MAG TPA: hypothetical protein DCS67_06510 [Clostridiales bacterium UBA8960]|jgi:hypothetical protein|nr:hypothetical protein [Clostridiales bacterium UBA8960]